MKKVIRLTESDLHRIVENSVKKIINEIGDTPKGQFMLGRLGARNMSNYAQQKGDKRGTAYLGGDEYETSMNGVGGYANKQRNKPSYAQPSKAFSDGFGTERKNEWDVANNTTPSYDKKSIDKKYDFWKNSHNMK